MANETVQTKPNTNGSKPNKTERNETKSNKTNQLGYEIPMPPEEALQCLTAWQREKRLNKGVTAVGYRVNGGMLMVEVEPEEIK